ncbi:LutC/YkgG family protein [Kineococcus sp. SYSU DK005]|uniref:LutC/YkgG family protein n=1 Tax=Kineococcus sp. SYSU DK005 TaxID=3383126 RepID=UPI003D7DDE93
MSGAREEVLARLRAARDAGAPRGGVPPVPRGYHRSGSLAPGSAGVLDLLVERVEDYRARVLRADSDDEVAGAVARCLDEAGSRRVVVPADLAPAWRPRTGDREVLEEHPGAPLTVPELDGLDAVVTASTVAVALTGTIVLAGGGEGQGRRALTLVPDHHVCVVRAADVVETVPEALARLDPSVPLTFISGPSATSDIELDRVEGVHGPRRLDVVVLG